MPGRTATKFSTRLHRYRKGRGFTPYTLGDRAGLSTAEIMRLERGEGQPESGTMVRLAEALGVPTRVVKMWATPIDIRAEVGGNLRRCRTDRGLAQEELALRAGMDRAVVSRMERGKMLPRIQIVLALSCALEVSPAEFFREIEWPRE